MVVLTVIDLEYEDLDISVEEEYEEPYGSGPYEVVHFRTIKYTGVVDHYTLSVEVTDEQVKQYCSENKITITDNLMEVTEYLLDSEEFNNYLKELHYKEVEDAVDRGEYDSSEIDWDEKCYDDRDYYEED